MWVMVRLMRRAPGAASSFPTGPAGKCHFDVQICICTVSTMQSAHDQRLHMLGLCLASGVVTVNSYREGAQEQYLAKLVLSSLIAILARHGVHSFLHYHRCQCSCTPAVLWARRSPFLPVMKPTFLISASSRASSASLAAEAPGCFLLFMLFALLVVAGFCGGPFCDKAWLWPPVKVVSVSLSSLSSSAPSLSARAAACKALPFNIKFTLVWEGVRP